MDETQNPIRTKQFLGTELLVCASELVKLLSEQVRNRAYNRDMIKDLNRLSDSYWKFASGDISKQAKERDELIKSDSRVRAIVSLARAVERELAAEQASLGGSFGALLEAVKRLED